MRQYENITQTLDNSLILDQQLETLNYHKKVLEARKMQELLRQNPEDDPIYQNHHQQHHQQQQPPNPVVYSHLMYDQYRLGGSSVQTTDLDDDDVSSSYSELTRTHQPQQHHHLQYAKPPHKDPGALTEVQKKVQLIQQQQQMLLGAVPTPTAMHQQKYSNYSAVQQAAAAAASAGHPQSTYSNYNYESIYEPINPRPPPQHQFQGSGGGGTYSSYSPAGSLYSASQHYGTRSECEVDTLTDMLVKSLNVDSGGSHIGRSPSQQSALHQAVGGGGGSSSYDNYSDLGGDNFGNCVKCGGRIIGENSGCTAMDQIYHIACFTCCECQINLQGKPFYPIDKQPYCEEDYLNTLEKCSVCLQPILDRILRATGKPYHPQCFTCIVCSKSLDGIPFTVDATNQIYCIEDFHK